MTTLKQLQEKGEEEFRKKFSSLYGVGISGMGYNQVDNVIDFLHQQTTLAYNAGKADMIDTVLKEIEEIKFTGSFAHDGDVYSPNEFNQTLDTLKNKLLDK